jgi:hypothetical protein
MHTCYLSMWAGGGNSAIAAAEAIQGQDIDATQRIQQTVVRASETGAATQEALNRQNEQVRRPG